MKSQNKNGNMFPPNIEGSRSVCRVYTNEDLCVQAGKYTTNCTILAGRIKNYEIY